MRGTMCLAATSERTTILFKPSENVDDNASTKYGERHRTRACSDNRLMSSASPITKVTSVSVPASNCEIKYSPRLGIAFKEVVVTLGSKILLLGSEI
eukprot:12411618-Karenia_brevis.AAC.1